MNRKKDIYDSAKEYSHFQTDSFKKYGHSKMEEADKTDRRL